MKFIFVILLFLLGSCTSFCPGFDGNINAPFNTVSCHAKGGDARAQYLMGTYFEIGEGVEKDIDEAIKWYEKASKRRYIAPRTVYQPPVGNQKFGTVIPVGSGHYTAGDIRAKHALQRLAISGEPKAQIHLDTLTIEELFDLLSRKAP